MTQISIDFSSIISMNMPSNILPMKQSLQYTTSNGTHITIFTNTYSNNIVITRSLFYDTNYHHICKPNTYVVGISIHPWYMNIIISLCISQLTFPVYQSQPPPPQGEILVDTDILSCYYYLMLLNFQKGIGY